MKINITQLVPVKRLFIKFLEARLQFVSAFILTIIVGSAPLNAATQGISVDDLIVVDCLLPGQVRQLGLNTKYITPRRPVKTSAKSCAIKGGEYVSYDRANYQTALSAWMADAELGDAKAQTYVAEIYERGLGTAPNYAEAAKWYALAAKQGYSPAQLSLGRLYEQGLGVTKDLLLALNYYRQANGLKQDELGFVSAMQNAADSGTPGELEALRKQVKKLEKTNKKLRDNLEKNRQDAEKSTQLLNQLQTDISNKQQLLIKARESDDLDQVVEKLNIQIKKQQIQLKEEALRFKTERALLLKEFDLQKKTFQKVQQSNDADAAIALLQKQLNLKQNQLEQATSEGDNQLRLSQERVIALEEDLVEAQQNNNSAEVIAALKTDINQQHSQYTQDIDQYEQEVALLRDEIRQQQQQVEIARQQDDSDAVIAMLEQQLAKQQDEFETTAKSSDKKLALLQFEIENQKKQAKLVREQDTSKEVIAKLVKLIKKQNKKLDKESKRNQKLTAKVTQQSEILAANEQKQQLAMAEGPSIILKVPPVIVKRGLSEVEVEPGQQVYLAGGVVAPVGVKAFTVNGVPANLDVNNLFMLKVNVQDSDLPVELKVIDKEDRISDQRLVLKPTSEITVVTSPAKEPSKKLKFGKYHALVIGNNDYGDGGWPSLNNAVNDARAVAELLEGRYGFDTKLLLNATRADTLQAVETLRNKLTEKDNLLIYYAGHGQRDDANNRAYWIPVDSTAESSANWIPSYQITDHVNAMNARHVLLVVDSCYAGLMTRATGVNAMLVGMTEEQKQAKVKDRLGRRTRMLITAGDNTEVLDSGQQGDHSIFAEAFLSALENNTGVLDSEGVFKTVQPYVAKQTYRINKQSVVYAPIPRARHEGGEFYFIAKNTN